MNRLLIFLLLVSLGCDNLSKGSQKEDAGTEDVNHQLKEVVVFVYHRFGNDKYPSTNVSLDIFEKHMKFLKDNSFRILSFGEAVDYVRNPEVQYSAKVACITVDDGYKTFIQNGLPILKKYNFPATVFINSESVGGGTYMDWDELKQIHDQGIEIGNHSHSHAYFVNCPESERAKKFREDVQTCQDAIRQHLGFTPDIFAYPYGEFDTDMKVALKSMGFKAAAAQNSGVMYNGDIFSIPRFPMAGPYTKLEGFMEKAQMKALRVRQKNPDSFLLRGQNPPVLTVAFESDSVDLSRANCFISNGCASQFKDGQFTIKSEKQLKNRRTLYTITAPAKSGKGWYWFSHLWIQPEVSE
jgi:peptidoglycan/xylan/chitin deacetylase (PgdA/CDA1 family)